MRHPPRQAMWSLRGLRPPVHRKWSVTATFGSVAVMPSAFNTWLMHSSLCRDRFVKETLTELSHGLQHQHHFVSSLTLSWSFAKTCLGVMVRPVWVRNVSLSKLRFSRNCSVGGVRQNTLIAPNNSSKRQHVEVTACWSGHYTLFCAGQIQPQGIIGLLSAGDANRSEGDSARASIVFQYCSIDPELKNISDWWVICS